MRPIDSGRLNNYISTASGLPVSAKTFRTWAGCVAAYRVAREAIVCGERATVKAMAEAAADVLSNTAAVCRSSYIHPGILDLAEPDVAIPKRWFSLAGRARSGLRAEETRLLRYLERCRKD